MIVPIAMAVASYLASQKKVKKPKYGQVDLSGELAKLDALYETQKQGVKSDLASQLAQRNAATSASMANRGVYSSPVSQYNFNANEQEYGNALAKALAQIAANQAQTRANLTGNLAQQQQQQAYDAAMAKYEGQLQSRNALSSSLMGLAMSGAMDQFGRPVATDGTESGDGTFKSGMNKNSQLNIISNETPEQMAARNRLREAKTGSFIRAYRDAYKLANQTQPEVNPVILEGIKKWGYK